MWQPARSTRRVKPAARPHDLDSRLHETAECLCSMAHPVVPSTHNQNRVGLRDHSFALGRGDVQLPLAGNSLQFVGATVLEGDT
jgi:hypothetical protein